MKKILFIFLLLFTFQNTNAQTWCPPGATWYYGSYYSGWGGGVIGYYKYEYVSDTTIQGILCKKIQKHYKTYSQSPIFTYADSNKVYLYRLNSFYTIFDFSANVGDTIIIPGRTDGIYSQIVMAGCDTLGAIKIDSIGITIINGELLRYICVSPTATSKWGYSGKIIEKIGHVTGDFPFFEPTRFEYCGMPTDIENETGTFRCYWDDNFTLYTIFSNSCDYALSINEYNNNGNISISPNPATTTITIESTKHQIQNIRIVDVLGREVLESTKNDVLSTKNIDVSQLLKGIYILQLQTDKGVVNKKFVKE